MSNSNDPVILTQKLVQVSSVTNSISPEQAEKIKELVNALGYEIEPVLAGNAQHFLARLIPKASKQVAFVCHYDVVPEGEGWSVEPYQGEIKDGVLLGRGAADMKSGLAAALTAGVEIAKEGIGVSVLIAGDEEDKSLGMPALLEKLEKLGGKIDLAIGTEPTSLDLCGDVVKCGRRGRIVARLTVFGDGGHAAYASQCDNPVEHISAIIQSIKSWRLEDGEGDLCPPTSIQITSIQGGSDKATNVVPGKVECIFDARLSINTKAEEFISALTERIKPLGFKTDLTTLQKTESFITRDPKLYALVKQVIHAEAGVSPNLNCSGGTSDARFVAAKGIPCIEIGVPNGRMHKADEFVKVKDIETISRIYLNLTKLYFEKIDLK